MDLMTSQLAGLNNKYLNRTYVKMYHLFSHTDEGREKVTYAQEDNLIDECNIYDVYHTVEDWKSPFGNVIPKGVYFVLWRMGNMDNDFYVMAGMFGEFKNGRVSDPLFFYVMPVGDWFSLLRNCFCISFGVQ